MSDAICWRRTDGEEISLYKGHHSCGRRGYTPSMSEVLEQFKSNIFDFDEARNCLANASKDFIEAD